MIRRNHRRTIRDEGKRVNPGQTNEELIQCENRWVLMKKDGIILQLVGLGEYRRLQKYVEETNEILFNKLLSECTENQRINAMNHQKVHDTIELTQTQRWLEFYLRFPSY